MRLPTLFVAILGYVSSCDGGSPPGGLKPGEAVSAFGTKAVTGPEKGRALCYV